MKTLPENYLLVHRADAVEVDHVDVPVAQIAIGLLVDREVEEVVFVAAAAIDVRQNCLAREATSKRPSIATRSGCF